MNPDAAAGERPYDVAATAVVEGRWLDRSVVRWRRTGAVAVGVALGSRILVRSAGD
jgi:hypothetical protein